MNITMGWAQNLVPNPSFEEHSDCPSSPGHIELAEPWTNVYGANTYFHECGTNGWSIPVNNWGGGYARTGHAYADITLWGKTFLFRKYIGSSLIDTLIPGKRYNVEFYVSMQDSQWYAVRNIGIYFSVTQPPQNQNFLLSKEPQIKYQGTNFLTEKEGWTKIEGSFIADGGETFITIGNFDDDADTDTLFVPGGGGYDIYPVGYWDNAGYFIDDVSVTVDTTTGINEPEQRKFEIYPNPADNNLTIELLLKKGEQGRIELRNISGTFVNTSNIQSDRTDIDVSQLNSGIYFYTIFINDLKQQSGKQIIIK